MATIAPTISHTLLETAKRCLKKTEYRWIRGYRPRIKGVKLERGTWVHELLAAYYTAWRDGRDPVAEANEAQKRMLQEKWHPLFDEEKEALGEDMPEEAWSIFGRYVRHWGAWDKENIAKILFVEKSLRIKLPWLPAPFEFKCDLVYLSKLGTVNIVDHKVVGSIPDEEDRMLDNQGPRYVLGIQEVLRRKGLLNKVKGVVVIYDYIRDRLPAEPKLNKDGSLSKAQIDTDYDTYMAAIKGHGLNPDDYAEILDKIARNQKPYFDRWPVPVTPQRLQTEQLEMAEAAGLLTPREFYPRSLDRTRCRWDCEYKDLCLIEIQGGDITPILKDRFEVVNKNG